MTSAKYIAFILTLMVIFPIRAQEKIMGYNIGLTYHTGYIIAHRSNVEILVNDYSRIAEFSFSKRFNGKNEWQQKYAYPYLGGSVMFFDFGNPEQLGKGVSLMAFYNFPLAQSDNLEFNFKIGFGPGYVEKVFDKEKNYKNYVVSTHFNGFAFGNINARYTFADHFALSAGLSISHFSNASAKKPNLGMNIPAINTGVTYRFGEKDKIVRESNHAYQFPEKVFHDVIAGFGKTNKEIEGEVYPTFTLAYAATKHLSFKSKVGAGADFFYNSSLKDQNNPNGDEIITNFDVMQLGGNISYALQIDDLSIFINQGIYIRTKYKEDGLFYNRFGVRYLAWKSVILNLSMKTHFAVADYVEFGLGYRLK